MRCGVSFPTPWTGVQRQGFPLPVVGPSSPEERRVGIVSVGGKEGVSLEVPNLT